MIQRKEVQPAKFNDELKEMYSWVNVAERTEKVYDAISQTRDPPLIERLRRYPNERKTSFSHVAAFLMNSLLSAHVLISPFSRDILSLAIMDVESLSANCFAS